MTDTAMLVLLKTGDVLCLHDGMSWRLPCVWCDSLERPFADTLQVHGRETCYRPLPTSGKGKEGHS